MAENARFFNSVDEDRIYSASDWSDIFDQMLSNGYVPEVDDELLVTTSGDPGMGIVIGTGAAWIQGTNYQTDAALERTVASGDATNPRIDRVVVKLDHPNRTIVVEVKEGTPTAEPNTAPPALQRDNDIWELSLAQVYVEANATSLTNDELTDERDDFDLCGQALTVGGGGATGSGGDKVFALFDQIITSNYTITGDKNALTAGPVTIADGVTVTIEDGATWTVV